MSSRWLILFLALLTLLDSVIGAFVLRVTGDPIVAGSVIYIKYAIFAAGLFGFLLRAARGMKLYVHEIYGLLYLILVGAIGFALLLSYPDHPAATRFHNYLFPVVIYFFGAYVSVIATYTWQQAVSIELKTYITISLLFGLPVYLFGAEWFWRDIIEYGEFVVNVKGLDDVLDGLPGNFFFDPNGLRVMRFVGSLGDPLAAGYSAMILLLISWFAFPRRRFILTLLLGGVIVAALTRAALLGAIVAMSFYYVFRRHGYRWLLLCCVVGIAIVLEYGDLIALILGDSSTEGHVLSISQVHDFLDPAGMLFGTLANGREGLFEPGFFNVLFTFGLITLVPLLLFIGSLYRLYAARLPDGRFVSVVFLAGTFTLAIFSPSFLAITSSWFAWFMAGFVSRSIVRHQQTARDGERGNDVSSMPVRA